VKKSIKEYSTDSQTALKTLDQSTKTGLEDLQTKHSELQQSMINRLNAVYEQINKEHTHFEDKDKGQTVLHEGVSKRIRIITNEIDDLKKQLDGQVVIVRRIETVEAKAQELWEQMDNVKNGSNEDTTEHLMNDIKSVTNTIFAIKSSLHKELADFKEDVSKGFQTNSTAVLEDKLNERINDSVKALTRQSADRLETKKSLRVLEKQLRNIFDIVTFMLN
jgi:hypothetical protein